MSILNLVTNIRRKYKKDGVLSWAVCFCAFVANAIVIGIDNSFGESLETIMEEFNSTESRVAWIGSAHSSAQYFSASLSSVLAKRFGFAPVIAIGILISSTCFAVSTTSYNVSALAVYNGLFAGFGLGLIYTPGNIICSFHFIRRRSLATAIAICGGGIGIILVSLPMDFIDASYGWKGCVILYACICPLCGVLAIITYILPEDYEKPPTTMEGNKNNLDEHVKRVGDENTSKFRRSITNALPLDLLKDSRLPIFCLAHCMYTLAKYVPIDFLPYALVNEHGISHIKAGEIIAFYGISSLAGRLISGIITNYLKNSAMLISSLCMVVLGCCCVGMAVSISYWQFVVCICIYGLFIGQIPVLLPISLVDMLGIECLKDSYGVIMFCSGISTLLGPPMVGWFKVIWGTYDFAFNITSGFYFMAGILAFIVLWIHKRSHKQYDISKLTI